MNRTRLLIVAILSLAASLVVAVLAWRTVAGNGDSIGWAAARPQALHVLVITAPPVEAWARAAAEEFNEAGYNVDGAPIEVELRPVDGLIALGKWERNEFNALPADVRPQDLSEPERANLEHFPAAWIADNRYLVEMANDAYRNRLGRDPFLRDGPYRMRSVAMSLLAWGVFRSRGTALQENLGELSWSTLRIAAAAPTGWKELGGDPAWGFFKLAIPDPRANVGGLATMMAAAGEHYERASISVEDVTDPQFQAWLAQLIGAGPGGSGGYAYGVEDFALFGAAAGDVGAFLESDLLHNMQGILTRWEEPPIIRYPRFATRFDFPFAIWVGPETSAQQKNAALAFQRFLRSEAQQRKALSYGLRPANAGIPVAGADDSLFVRWRKLGVQDEVTPAEGMRAPNRDILLALLRWYDMSADR